MDDLFVGDGPASFISGTIGSTSGSTESRIIVGVSSGLPKSGSVICEALCKGVEDKRCSLLACKMPSLARGVMGVVDKDDTE